MVYESDFYTIRRPRPTITSYSVTGPRLGVSTWKVKPSIRTSVLIGELDRIYHRPRPHLGYAPMEDFLNSRPLVDFDDETRLIKAETERLMRRVYTSLPHPRNSAPLQVLPYYGSCYGTHAILEGKRSPLPERPHQPMVDDILFMSYYSEPSARTIGRGHLACVTFAGGRGYPRRRHLYRDENRDIGDEIKTRSYYNNNYHKSYVDAMSLPTGYASYLLRIKPPEHEPLTNLDKMRIIALGEERKRNARNNQTGRAPKLENKQEQTSTLTNELVEPIEALVESKKPFKRQSSKQKAELLEELREEVRREIKESDVTYENKVIEEIYACPTAVPEPVMERSFGISEEEMSIEKKPEKKLKTKKSNLVKTPSFPEEIKSQPLEEKQIEPESAPMQAEEPIEIRTKDSPAPHEEERATDIPATQLEEREAGQCADPQVLQAEETRVEEEAPLVTPASELVQVPVVAVEPDTAVAEKEEREPIAEEPSTTETTFETCPFEPEAAAAAEPVKCPQEEDATKTEEPQLQISSTTPDNGSLQLSPVSDIAEHSTEFQASAAPAPEVSSSEEKLEACQFEELSAEELPNKLPSEVAVEPPNQQSSEAPVELPNQLPSGVPVESTPVKEITEGDSCAALPQGSQLCEGETRDIETADSGNVIEEVEHELGTNKTGKEYEPEPLVEEPQSPCDNIYIISNKTNSNEITEILSDVAEEC